VHRSILFNAFAAIDYYRIATSLQNLAADLISSHHAQAFGFNFNTIVLQRLEFTYGCHHGIILTLTNKDGSIGWERWSILDDVRDATSSQSGPWCWFGQSLIRPNRILGQHPSHLASGNLQVRSYSTRFLWASFHFVEKTPKGRGDHAMIRRQQQPFVYGEGSNAVFLASSPRFFWFELTQWFSPLYRFWPQNVFWTDFLSGIGRTLQVQSITSLCPNLWGWFLG
jgi:hypothetical protein